MVDTNMPFDRQKILDIMEDFPTPFHIYDEKAIRENAKKFKEAFSILPGFKEFFAVKACPNPFLIKILKQEGFGVDCSSLPELMLAEKVGILGENIMMSSNDTPAIEFKKCRKLGGIINLDDISHIAYLEKHAGLPDLICFRYNPGPAKKGNAIIGDPKEAKYGFTKEQMFQGYKICKEKGVKRFGMHTMMVSNEQEISGLRETAKMMFELALEVKEKTGIEVEFINLGGGIGTPYEPDKPNTMDYQAIAVAFKEEYDKYFSNSFKPKVYLECGRTITGPFGWLITAVRHIKHTYKDYVGTDASMANLMRPGMYGAYHHIEVIGKESAKKEHKYDVTGSLCENNDKFAVDRMLPEIVVGDILAIFNAGAHGHAMGFNYNGKLRSSELLLREDGSVEQIRRAETVEDYFATLDFDKLNEFN
ncbi:MAG: diaminopimelate decarboxylase [Candidatus Woesearchaeota archaeon]